jgi:mannose/fructose/N-acetylgalactosamine-specific phosphotransferase system component IIC
VAGFLIGATLLGALILLDRWQVGEFGLSQPIVACPLLGLVYGDVGAGLYFGMALQLAWMAALPLGRQQSLDYQGAGVVGVLSYFVLSHPAARSAGGDSGQYVFVSLLIAVFGSFLGAALDVGNKRVNNSVYRRGTNAPGPGRAVLWHLAGLATGMLRGVVLVGVFLIIAVALSRFVGMLPSFSWPELLALPLGLGIAAGFRMFVSLRRLPWAAAGGALAGLLWLVFKQ